MSQSPENDIDRSAEDAMQSFEGIERACPQPFLITRVLARINRRRSMQNGWEKIGAFISRPGLVAAGLACILLINAAIIYNNNNNTIPTPVQKNVAAEDEFAIQTFSIYDAEYQ